MEQHERDWVKFFFETMIELNRIDRTSYVCRHVFGWDIIINTLHQMAKNMLRGGDCHMASATAAHNGLANRILELVQAMAPRCDVWDLLGSPAPA